jgi:hypothetical protein
VGRQPLPGRQVRGGLAARRREGARLRRHLVDFGQLALFPDKTDFDRYWYSEEIATARALASGLYQVPVLPSYWEVSGMGALQPEDALS